MTDHLPECIFKPENVDSAKGIRWGGRPCICDALRACEQRVAEETEATMMEFFYWKPSPPHDKHYFADNICAYCVGYREAFTAARKAVAALPEYKMRDTCVAAIDALREKP